MKHSQRTTAILWAVIAALAIAVISLWVAHTGTKTELGQTIDSKHTIETERDTLKAQAQSLAASAAESRRGWEGAQAELMSVQLLQQDMQHKLQALSTDKETVAQNLIAVQQQAKAAAATSEELSRELESAKQSLDQASAALAERTAAFAELQKTHAQLQRADSAKQTELDKAQQLQQETRQKLAALEHEAKTAAATSKTLSRELESTQKSFEEARSAAAQRSAAFEDLRKTYSQLQATAAAKQAELEQVQQLQQAAQQKLQALSTERATAVQKLAGVQDQAQAAAAAKVKLTQELGTTKEVLEAARARSAELNKTYEKLLKDYSKLSATDAARQEELARTRTAFEEAQNEVARLTGARGIYTVQSADSLSSIAAYFYRKGHRWPDIHQANDFLAQDPDLVYAGQVLIIPK